MRSPQLRLLDVVAGAGLAAWVGVLLGRSGFWRGGPILPDCRHPTQRDSWPTVTAVVPARNEAALIEQTSRSLAQQDYPGSFQIVVVDDRSSDDTAGAAAKGLTTTSNSQILTGTPTRPGWAGKLWALSQGIEAAGDGSDWLWFTDADIAHEPDVLCRLVALATDDDRDLVSVMARLRTETFFERLIVPAFVYFFSMLYPFEQVARPGRIAAAAGGCILVRRSVLEKAGGLEAISGALIDDVALATTVKKAGARLWLGSCEGVRSVRAYPRLGDLWHMVARSAYDELDYSPVRLAGALGGLALMFAVPSCVLVAAISGRQRSLFALLCGTAAIAVETASYLPILRRYELEPLWLWALSLTPAGWLYAAMTTSSAWSHHMGRPVSW